MAYYEDNSISHDVELNAGFRAWASKIHKALEEVGLVNTKDKGEINLETVEAPAISTFAGFEMWRFNDSRQGAEPIYIKVEYGKAANTKRPNLRLTYGTGTNGEGTLTNASAAISQTPTGTPGGNGYIYAVLRDGVFSLLSCANTATTGATAENLVCFTCERLKDVNLQSINGFAASKGVGGSQVASWTVWYEGAWKTAQVITASGSPTSVGGILMPTLTYLMSPAISAPLRGICGAQAGVIGSGDTGKLLFHTEEVTFLRLPIGHGINFVGGETGAANVVHDFLMIHE